MKNVFFISMILIVTGFVAQLFFPQRVKGEDIRVKHQCYEYESKGYIDKGSCACSEQLFDTWDESYNWMDACMVLKSRERFNK